MESSKPSSSAPPYAAAGAGAGAGGKFRKPPVSRKRPSTPYDRPSLTPANKKSDASVEDAGGWLSKLVVNPARRLIVGGATRILPSFFSKSESSSAEEDEYDSSGDRDSEDVDATVNVPSDAKHTLQPGVSNSCRDAGPSNQMDKLKGSPEHANVQQDKSIDDFDQIENMLKGKQLSRDESNRLIEILKSRLVDDTNAEEEKKAANVSSQGQDKLNELDHEMPTTGKQYDVETPMPRLPSNIQEEVAASPIDIAKAYMGSRALEIGVNTYSNTSTDRREHEQNVLFPSKPHFLTPSSKSSTCWPGAVVQDHRAYLTPQTQRSRDGLHNFPRTPYSRTKPKLSQLHGDSRPSNVSLTPFQQSHTPNLWKKKTSSDVMDGGYGSVGPIRRIRNKSVPEPRSEGPRSFAPAQIASSSNASRSFVPVFQKNPATPATSNLYTADRDKQQTFKNEANSAGPTNETVKKILDQLDRHKPTPKEKAAELKLATEWKSSPSETSNSKMPIFTTTTGPNLQKSGVLNEDRPFQKGTDGGVSFEDPKKASNTTTKPLASGNEAGAGPSFGFKNTGVANEKSTVGNSKENEKSQPWSFDKRINGQELPRKRPSQPTLKPISFKRPDPQQVVSSDNGHGFTFSFSSAATGSASEPPTPSIMPTLPLTATPAAQAKELPGLPPTYSFGTKKSSERVVFSFPSTSSAPIGDGVSDLKFNFGSGKKRVSFGSIGSDAIISS